MGLFEKRMHDCDAAPAKEKVTARLPAPLFTLSFKLSLFIVVLVLMTTTVLSLVILRTMDRNIMDEVMKRAETLGKSAAETKRNDWTRKMKVYLDCLKSFASDQQAAAAPHIKAANAAVEEFNKAIKIYNDQIDAARQ